MDILTSNKNKTYLIGFEENLTVSISHLLNKHFITISFEALVDFD